MTIPQACSATILFLFLMTRPAAAQLMTTCAPDSPERQGGIGCTIVETKPLPEGLEEPLYWHIDRFDTLAQARAAVGPASVAFEAAGIAWLMTIESQRSDHQGDRHVAHVGPLPVPRAAKYVMQVQSAAFMPGMYSLPHHHSGAEAVYVVEGEACYETPKRAAKLQKGETLAMPAETPMRAVVTGSSPRHVLAVIVHDAAQPATMRMDEGTAPKLVLCK
jgi:quercetin dioxygenase-like cupin family protein